MTNLKLVVTTIKAKQWCLETTAIYKTTCIFTTPGGLIFLRSEDVSNQFNPLKPILKGNNHHYTFADIKIKHG